MKSIPEKMQRENFLELESNGFLDVWRLDEFFALGAGSKDAGIKRRQDHFSGLALSKKKTKRTGDWQWT